MKRVFEDPRTILIVTGGPGTGKSSMAKGFLDYSENDDIVSVSYDFFKEKEWDTFGFDNEVQKKRVNEFALEEFYLTLQKLMWEGRTILAEYPFYQYHRPKLKALIEESAYSAVTLYLYTDLLTAYERGIRRDGEGGRHPGHLLHRYHPGSFRPELLQSRDKKELTFEEFKESIRDRDYDIALGRRIEVDVTDFSRVSFENVYQRILGS